MTESLNCKTICLAFPDKKIYKKSMEDPKIFRDFLIDTFEKHPELFPEDFKKGFKLHGTIPSNKQKGFVMRRIQLKNKNKDTYQIRPSFMMPYMIEETDQIEKALYLRRWGVPFDALAYVFGHNAMFWYRAYISLGHNSIVGTTIKDPGFLPEHLLADEKHTRHNSEKIYVATTVAKGCILGSGIAQNAGTKALTEGYNDFKEEIKEVDPNYQPKTVNTDGWEPTQKAWKTLFPTITIILCFLHSFLKIRDRCRRNKETLKIITEKVWNVYNCDTLAQFSQRIRRFREWTQKNLASEPVGEKILDMCEKASLFKITFSQPEAYRTSNMLDRLMNYQDRMLYAMQYFHGNHKSCLLYLRSMALIWNFHPYGSKTVNKYPDRSSPFKDLNGFTYHNNWLQNMLVASSMGGHRM